MKFLNFPVTFLLTVLFSIQAVLAQTTSVKFNVNMNQQIVLQQFDVTSEFVDLAGDFNGWGDTETRLSDDDSDGIYSVSIDLNIGSTVEYKARINGEWNGREEFANGGPNRSYTVEENGVVDIWYNDEVSDDVLQVRIGASSVINLPGEAVQFYDRSSGDPVSHMWSFPRGNPSVSTDKNPVVTYSEEGSYSVTLTITNVDGDSETKVFEDYMRIGETGTFWWNDAVFYEIFVRSFYDDNGDGRGDFKGLTAKLDYLNDGDPATHADLGITGIWLMPIQQSPSYHGYDATDYRTIEKDYGTNDDFKEFIGEAHKRGIHVIIDYVMNHSSSQHPWFRDSDTPGSSKRDWYVWENSKPNGNGPWGQNVWHQRNGNYFYGLFWDGMPDLNYNTPAVKEEMFDIARFWLEDMSVDGFRLDAVKYIYETSSSLEDTDETFQFWKDFRAYYKSINPDAFAVGEAWTSTDKVKKYVENDGLDYCFEFDLANAILNAADNGNASGLTNQMEHVMGAYPFLQFGTFLTNHDINRVMNVLGKNEEKAVVAANLLLTLPGIPYIYYGEEIGMLGRKPDEDIRTPLQWNSTTNAGFTSGRPWRNPNSDYPTKNIERQQSNYSSIWHSYRQLIAIRNNQAALRKGTYKTVSSDESSAVVFLRQHEEENVMVASNVGTTDIADLQVSLSFGGITSGAYTMVELQSGGQTAVSIDASGGFSNLSLGSIAGRSTKIFKLMESNSIPSEMTFMVDMNEMIETKAFDPNTESVDLISNFNNWGTNLLQLTDNDEDGIYTLVASPQNIGNRIEYKYRINGVDDGREEFSNSSFVREYTVLEGQNNVLDSYQQLYITNIEEDIQTEPVVVYPMPVDHEMLVKLPESITGKVQLRILDLFGSEIIGSDFFYSGSNETHSVSTSQLSAGVYFLSINALNYQEVVTVVVRH